MRSSCQRRHAFQEQNLTISQMNIVFRKWIRGLQVPRLSATVNISTESSTLFCVAELSTHFFTTHFFSSCVRGGNLTRRKNPGGVATRMLCAIRRPLPVGSLFENARATHNLSLRVRSQKVSISVVLNLKTKQRPTLTSLRYRLWGRGEGLEKMTLPKPDRISRFRWSTFLVWVEVCLVFLRSIFIYKVWEGSTR